jgi:CheY-like chemotaxis protein
MSKKILFIDSDEAFAQGLSQAASARGHAPLVSTNSEQGITLARQESPDVIVVCVEAQPTNGYMLCTRLKKDDRLKSIPVILTSANATPDSFEKHKKLKTRADEYLIKPFDGAALFAKVNPLVGLPHEAAEEVVDIQDEPLGMGIGDLVTGQDEPIAIGDELVAPGGGEEIVVDEVEEVVHIDEQSPTAEGDPDLQMFDRAFDALEMPSAPKADHPDTAPIPSVAEEHAAPEAAHLGHAPAHDEAVPAANTDGEKSIDELLGSLEGDPALAAHDVHGSGATAELEARVHQLEQELAMRTAEVEAAKAQSSGGSAEVMRLKEQRNRQDKEILRLKEELHGKDRELIGLQETQTELEAQVQSQKDESIKREAAAKALQQRAEALAAAAKKFERELSAAREELKTLPALKARLVELDKVASEAPGLQKKLAEASAEADRAKAQVAALQGEAEQLKDLHGTELAGARELHAQEVTQLKGEITATQHDLSKAHEEMASAREQASRLGGDLEAIRAEMQTLVGEKELLADEREELKKAVAEAQAQAAQNEERAVKAYQKIKGDERLRERTRKALTIALQLLDEAPSLEAVDEPSTAEIAKQIA